MRTKLRAELPGVCIWAMEGLKRLRRNKGRFTTPGLSKIIKGEFDRQSSPVNAFVQEMLLVNRRLDPGDLPNATFTDDKLFISRDRVYRLYSDWCERYNMEPRNDKWFGVDLRNTLPKLGVQDKGHENGKQVNGYKGLGEKPTGDIVHPLPKHTAVKIMEFTGRIIQFFGGSNQYDVRLDLSPERFATLDDAAKNRIQRLDTAFAFRADVAEVELV